MDGNGDVNYDDEMYQIISGMAAASVVDSCRYLMAAKMLQDKLVNSHFTPIKFVFQQVGEVEKFTGFRLNIIRKGSIPAGTQTEMILKCLNTLPIIQSTTFSQTSGMPRVLQQLCFLLTEGGKFTMTPNVRLTHGQTMLPESFKQAVNDSTRVYKFDTAEFVRYKNKQHELFPALVLERFGVKRTPIYAIMYKMHEEPELFCNPKSDMPDLARNETLLAQAMLQHILNYNVVSSSGRVVRLYLTGTFPPADFSLSLCLGRLCRDAMSIMRTWVSGMTRILTSSRYFFKPTGIYS